MVSAVAHAWPERGADLLMANSVYRESTGRGRYRSPVIRARCVHGLGPNTHVDPAARRTRDRSGRTTHSRARLACATGDRGGAGAVMLLLPRAVRVYMATQPVRLSVNVPPGASAIRRGIRTPTNPNIPGMRSTPLLSLSTRPTAT